MHVRIRRIARIGTSIFRFWLKLKRLIQGFGDALWERWGLAVLCNVRFLGFFVFGDSGDSLSSGSNAGFESWKVRKLMVV